jgi:hypothetical protein
VNKQAKSLRSWFFDTHSSGWLFGRRRAFGSRRFIFRKEIFCLTQGTARRDRLFVPSQSCSCSSLSSSSSSAVFSPATIKDRGRGQARYEHDRTIRGGEPQSPAVISPSCPPPRRRFPPTPSRFAATASTDRRPGFRGDGRPMTCRELRGCWATGAAATPARPASA